MICTSCFRSFFPLPPSGQKNQALQVKIGTYPNLQNCCVFTVVITLACSPVVLIRLNYHHRYWKFPQTHGVHASLLIVLLLLLAEFCFYPRRTLIRLIRWNSCKQNKQGANNCTANQNQTPSPEGEKLHSDSGISVDSQSLQEQQGQAQAQTGNSLIHIPSRRPHLPMFIKVLHLMGCKPKSQCVFDIEFLW